MPDLDVDDIVAAFQSEPRQAAELIVALLTEAVRQLRDARAHAEVLVAQLAIEKARADRLQDVLDCGTGKRAPEGWVWQASGWVKGKYRVQRIFTPGVIGTHSWSYLDDGWTTDRYFGSALECIEAIEASEKVEG